MKKEKQHFSSVEREIASTEPNSSFATDVTVERHWQGVVKRR